MLWLGCGSGAVCATGPGRSRPGGKGGEAISDLSVLRDQAAPFGPIASDPTAW